MTQRIFDTDNEQDMQDLWNILPDDVTEIQLEKRETNTSSAIFNGGYGHSICGNLININWYDKTKITRPIQEATEQDIGKLCAFWYRDDKNVFFGILDGINKKDDENYAIEKFYCMKDGYDYYHCRRLTKQEIEELC